MMLRESQSRQSLARIQSHISHITPRPWVMSCISPKSKQASVVQIFPRLLRNSSSFQLYKVSMRNYCSKLAGENNMHLFKATNWILNYFDSL